MVITIRQIRLNEGKIILSKSLFSNLNLKHQQKHQENSGGIAYAEKKQHK